MQYVQTIHTDNTNNCMSFEYDVLKCQCLRKLWFKDTSW